MVSPQTEHPKPQLAARPLPNGMTLKSIENSQQIEPFISSLYKLVRSCVAETKDHPSLEFGGIGSKMALDQNRDYWRGLLSDGPSTETGASDPQSLPLPRHHDHSSLYLFIVTNDECPSRVLATLQLVFPNTGPTAKKCEIVNLMVAKRFRRQGLARSLIKYAEDVCVMREMKQITAHADTQSLVDEPLRRAAFKIVGSCKMYAQNPDGLWKEHKFYSKLLSYTSGGRLSDPTITQGAPTGPRLPITTIAQEAENELIQLNPIINQGASEGPRPAGPANTGVAPMEPKHIYEAIT
ncbi:hypothetical protein PG987_001289 [Apiospora arundinis]